MIELGMYFQDRYKSEVVNDEGYISENEEMLSEY
jgi:hypothetical protein